MNRERPHDVLVVNRHDVRRMSGDDVQRLDAHRLGRCRFAVHHAVEHRRRLETDSGAGELDAREWGAGDAAHQFVGVAGEDCHLIRHADLEGVANLRELSAAMRIDGKDRDRPREGCEPLGDQPLLLAPADTPPNPITWTVDGAFASRRAHHLPGKLHRGRPSTAFAAARNRRTARSPDREGAQRKPSPLDIVGNHPPRPLLVAHHGVRVDNR